MKRAYHLLAVFWLLACSEAYASSIDKLRNFMENNAFLSGHFEQTMVKKQRTQTIQGKFYIQRPNRLRWEYTTPSSLLIIADGKQVWLYDTDLKQVSIRNQDDVMAATPAAIFTQGGRLEEHFTLKDLGKSKDELFWVSLKPKQTESGYQEITIALTENNVVVYLNLLDNFNQTTQIKFKEINKNQLAESLFKFKPPTGVEIIKSND